MTTQQIPGAKQRPLSKKSLKEKTKEFWKNKIEPLVKQGNLLKLENFESTDLAWKSSMYNLPKGVLSFAARAAIDVLPTPDNLCQWGKHSHDNCTLCNSKGTQHHILNFCQVSLEQGRYTFRHNNILRYIVKFLVDNSNGAIKVFSDIKGYTINGGTIPASIIPTQEKPDICVVNALKRHVTIIELTVPFETNISKARQRKLDRYAALVADINKTKYIADLICLEVGSRGLINKDNKSQIRQIASLVGEKRTRSLWRDISRIALLSSYAIFNARHESKWVDYEQFYV